MMALLRLALGAFFLGGGMVFGFLLLRMLRALVSPLPADFPDHLRERLPRCKGIWAHKRRDHPRCRALFRFGCDLVTPLGISVVFILFLFWYGDGIPRLFVFLMAGGGALIGHFILSPLFLRVSTAFLFLTRFLLLMLWDPVALVAERIASAFHRFLRKAGGFFIKHIQRQNTKHRSRRYEKKEMHRICGNGFRTRLLAALAAEKGEDGI